MEKRLTISDYLFALLFIFMFFCIIVAFFYGVDVGKNRAAEHYEKLLQVQADEPLAEELTTYHQQHLVSFYYNVYYPFRTFQSTWITTVHGLDTRGAKGFADELKRLSTTAEEVYASIETMAVPATSPLLQQAQTDYLRSLRLFQETGARAKELANNSEALSDDPFVQEAVKHATAAQDAYYEAIVRWHESVVVDLPGADLVDETTLGLSEWQSLPFNVRNSIVAQAMAEAHIFANYTPQDMTAALASMVDTGNAQSVGVGNVQEAIRLLHNTRAVRSGDYFTYQDAYFRDEIIPELPFYINQDSHSAP